jgi:hypothetical protein
LSLGPGEPPPATGAAELVPANALLYLHVSTDPSRPAVRRALALSQRLPASPLLFAAITARLGAVLTGSSGTSVSFAAEVRPWLGREAALAVLDTPSSSAGSLVVLDVRNRAAARRFLADVGARPDGVYRRVSLLAQGSGTVLAFLRHYLVLGQPTSVLAAIDVAAGRARSLAADGGYRRAAAGEPADRVLDAYGSVDGIRRALVPRNGLLGDLGALLDEPGLSAATISISPVSRGLRVLVHRALDPRLVGLTRSQPVGFSPTLAHVLPARSTLVIDVHGLRASVPRLLTLAAKAGIASRIGPVLSRLGSALVAQGVDLRQVLAIFSGETVIGVTPGRDGSGPAPVIVTRAGEEARTRALLAGLEVPLTQVFTPSGSGPGQVPEITDTTVAGVAVHQLSLAPGFGLDYAVAHGLVVISTGTSAIASVFAAGRRLDQAPSIPAVLPEAPGRVTSLVFVDLTQLLRLGERSGLIGSQGQATTWSAAEGLRAVSLASWRGAYDTTTELQLQIP